MTRKEVLFSDIGFLSRRNLLTGSLATAAVIGFGVDGILAKGRANKIRKELEEIRPQIPEEQIKNARELVTQYNNCQEITDNRCEEIMQPRKVAEVHR